MKKISVVVPCYNAAKEDLHIVVDTEEKGDFYLGIAEFRQFVKEAKKYYDG